MESCSQEELREDSRILPWLVEHSGSIWSRCQKGRDGRTPLERLHGKKLTQEFVPFGEWVLARPISSETVEQHESQIQVRRLGVRNNSAECFVKTAEGAFKARQEDRTARQVGQRSVIGVPWRVVDGKRTVDRPVTQIDPLPPPVPFEGVRVQRERITRTDIEAFGTTAGCPGCNAIRSGKRAEARSDPSRVRFGECLQTSRQGAERSEARFWMRHSPRKLREMSEEERRSEVLQESSQFQRSRKTCRSRLTQTREIDVQ